MPTPTSNKRKGKQKITKEEYRAVFDALMYIFMHDTKAPKYLLKYVDMVGNYLGDKAMGRKPDLHP